MNALIDTCVVIDALQKREPFWQDAARVFHSAAVWRFKGFITAKALADTYYIMRRALHNDQQTRELLEKLLTLFHLLDTSATDCRQALASNLSDFEDALMAETAMRSGLDLIVTRNLKDYVKAPIEVLSPIAFLTRLERV